MCLRNILTLIITKFINALHRAWVGLPTANSAVIYAVELTKTRALKFFSLNLSLPHPSDPSSLSS